MATAHPHVDPDGTVYNMGNAFMGAKGPTYNVIKFPPKKTLSSGMEYIYLSIFHLFFAIILLHSIVEGVK